MVHEIEAESVPGIEEIVLRELETFAGQRIRSARIIRPGFIRFAWNGEPYLLSKLRSVVALYEIHHFDVPRPKALLGHEHFKRLIGILRCSARRFSSKRSSLGIGAAGADSTVMLRLKRELATELQVPLAADDKGELYLRLLRPTSKSGWEILVRSTEAPLSKRAWRIRDIPGALNATVAYAMTQLHPQNDLTRVVNLCCGTATIAIEQVQQSASGSVLALDNRFDMLCAANINLLHSGTRDRVQLLCADARCLPLTPNSVDRFYADLPFGNRIGSHEDNLQLYPRLLREASRLAKERAIFVLLTHEVNLLRRCTRQAGWDTLYEKTIVLSGLHPRLFVLRRKSARI